MFAHSGYLVWIWSPHINYNFSVLILMCPQICTVTKKNRTIWVLRQNWCTEIGYHSAPYHRFSNSSSSHLSYELWTWAIWAKLSPALLRSLFMIKCKRWGPVMCAFSSLVWRSLEKEYRKKKSTKGVVFGGRREAGAWAGAAGAWLQLSILRILSWIEAKKFRKTSKAEGYVGAISVLSSEGIPSMWDDAEIIIVMIGGVKDLGVGRGI